MTSYPPAPWHMHGDMWLTVFRIGEDIDELHPAGIYGAALVDYREPSPLTYGELLVARMAGGDAPAGGKGRAVSITDIWVDSSASKAGGRELWAIPKELCEFDRVATTSGPLTRTRWAAATDGHPVVEARFADVSRYAPRVPFTGRVVQPGIPDHPDVAHVTMRGNAKAVPCRAKWQFDPNGPLAFLDVARQLGSFRMRDFRLEFN